VWAEINLYKWPNQEFETFSRAIMNKESQAKIKKYNQNFKTSKKK